MAATNSNGCNILEFDAAGCGILEYVAAFCEFVNLRNISYISYVSYQIGIHFIYTLVHQPHPILLGLQHVQWKVLVEWTWKAKMSTVFLIHGSL